MIPLYRNEKPPAEKGTGTAKKRKGDLMFGLLETAILEKTSCREAIFSKVAGGSLATHSLIFCRAIF